MINGVPAPLNYDTGWHIFGVMLFSEALTKTGLQGEDHAT
jgi:hypothetical protein